MQLSRLDVSVLPVKKSPSKKPAVPRPSGDRLDAELSDAERLAGDLLEQHEDVLADEITIEEPLPQVRHHEREVNRQGAVIDQSPALEADQSAPSRDAEPGGHRSRSPHRGAEQHLIAHHATFGEGLPQAQQVVDPVRQRGRPGSGAGAGDPLHQALPTKEVESRPDGVAGDAIVLSQSRLGGKHPPSEVAGLHLPAQDVSDSSGAVGPPVRGRSIEGRAALHDTNRT